MNLKLLALPALLSAVACLIVWYGGWSLWELTALWEKGVENTQWQTLLIGLSALFTALIMLPSAYITTRTKNRQPQPEAIIQRRPQQNTDPTETETEEDIEDEEEDYIKTQPQQKVKLKSKSDIRLQRQQEAINAVLQNLPAPTIDYSKPKKSFEEAQAEINQVLTEETAKEPEANPDKKQTLDELEEESKRKLSIEMRENLSRQLRNDKLLVVPNEKSISKLGIEGFNIKVTKNAANNKQHLNQLPQEQDPDQITPQDLLEGM